MFLGRRAIWGLCRSQFLVSVVGSVCKFSCTNHIRFFYSVKFFELESIVLERDSIAVCVGGFGGLVGLGSRFGARIVYRAF
jgi:hypothetical protein